MAVTATFVQPLQVMETAEMRERIKAIANAEGISQAAVIRDLIAAGIKTREEGSGLRLAIRAQTALAFADQ